MSKDTFSEDCPGCLPCVIDPLTSQMLPDDHPIMIELMKIWKQTTREERKSYHAVMCLNSREPRHVKDVKDVMDRLSSAFSKAN